MKKATTLFMAILLLLVAALPAAAQEDQDIVEIASGNEDFSTLVMALQQAGLVETLQGEGPFTVFAPTDAAFAALPAGTLEALDNETLAAILTYHVVAGEVTAEQVLGMAPTSVDTVQGEAVEIAVSDGMVMVNDATVVTADIMASNGVIHVIDSVLLPPSVVAAMTESAEMDDSAAAESAPATLPETGASSNVPTSLLALAVAAIGLLLVVGGWVYRPQAR